MSASAELEAWMVMTATFGLGLALSNVKSIFRPFLLYAVIGGIAVWRFQRNRPSRDVEIQKLTFQWTFYGNPRKETQSDFIHEDKNTDFHLIGSRWGRGGNRLSPAVAMSLNRG